MLNLDLGFAMQKRVCCRLALAVYQPLHLLLNMHFPTQSSGQLCEAGAAVIDEETDLPKATWEMWSEHKLRPLDSQP